MSTEVRRISLKTVPQNVSNNVDKSDNKKKSSKEPKTPKEPKTKRFVLDLNTESEECNEFSYNDLIKSFDNKNGEPNTSSEPLDPLAMTEDEHCLKELEKHFQQKYGPKKTKRMEDYIDKGMGYDETDPFIDNEEAYDELVPSTLTTKYGGFYINCGELEFRALSPEKDMEVEDDDEDNIRPVVKRKRKMDLLIDAKRRRSSTELKAKKSNKIQNSSKTVAQMLQQKKTLKPNNSENSDEIEEIEINDSDSNDGVVSTSVRDVIDSVAKGEDQPNGEEKNVSNGSIELENEDLNKKDNPMISVNLPEGLPQELTQMIEKIKKLAEKSRDGKRNFFNEEVNDLLFGIERKCRSLALTNRTQVYSHLATHLPCSKQTLMSRAKKISTETYDYELQTALTNIRVLVQLLTPRIFENYQKLMEEAKNKFEQRAQNGVEPESPIKLPRRVFMFSTELKRQLNSAVTAKLNLYDQIGSKSHSISLKDYLYEFLDKEIKPVFPKGWMSLEILKHKIKWIKQILPAEQKPSVPPPTQSGSQPMPQPVIQSSQPTAPPTQSTPQIQSQPNRVQTQHLSNERLTKSQPIIEKTNKIEIISIEHKLTSNPSIKSVPNSYQMPNKVSDSLSEGLVSKFISNPKEVKDNVTNNSEAINLISIDLSTKARSSPKPFNTPTARLSPINLKTSPNQMSAKNDSLKASTPSPSASPLAMNSILGSYKTEKLESKLSHEACLTKVIEQSLGDYPNSSANISNNQRNSKSTSLPQTPLPFNEMFAKSFNSPLNKDSKPEICIEIASSPEPYNRVHQKTQQTNVSKQQTTHTTPQQFSTHPKTSTPIQSQPKPTISSSNSASNLNYMRTTELPKKKNTMSLIQPSNAQKEQELRSNVSKMDQSILQINANSNRNSSRDTSITITPISIKTSDNSVNTTKHNSSANSRHSISSTGSITSTTPTYSEPTYIGMFQSYLQSVNNLQHPIRFPLNMDYSSIFHSSQNPQNLYYPFTTTSTTSTHKTGGKEK